MKSKIMCCIGNFEQSDSSNFDAFVFSFNLIVSELDRFLSTPEDSFTSRSEFLEEFGRHFGALHTLYMLSLISGASYQEYRRKFYDYRYRCLES